MSFYALRFPIISPEIGKVAGNTHKQLILILPVTAGYAFRLPG
jgi:hypothetical protein